jgi:hypothetical protein
MAESGNASPAEVEEYLHGLDFPSDKDDLISKARDNGAPDDVISLLDNLPEQDYHSPIEVSNAIGNLK